MDFASNLDFEEYLQDFEVKTMLQALKHRVKEIKKEHAEERKAQEAKHQQDREAQEARQKELN